MDEWSKGVRRGKLAVKLPAKRRMQRQAATPGSRQTKSEFVEIGRRADGSAIKQELVVQTRRASKRPVCKHRNGKAFIRYSERRAYHPIDYNKMGGMLEKLAAMVDVAVKKGE